MREWIEIEAAARGSCQRIVSLYMREWIEIIRQLNIFERVGVSLYMREWIEIDIIIKNRIPVSYVSLYMREWIEIPSRNTTTRSSAMSPST